MLSGNNGHNALIRRRQLILLLRGISYWATLLAWVVGDTLLLIICNVLLFLYLVSLLWFVTGWAVWHAGILHVTLVVALINNLRPIWRLQMYIIQCFTHVYRSLYAVIRILLCLFYHDVGS